jgi:acyl-CoA synthetase (AMP-forming)/AMP-acid ligase II
VGPQAPFEVEEVTVGGVTVRSFVRGPATIMDAFQMTRAHSDKVHLVFRDQRLTFADVRAQSLSLARHLRRDFQITRGDRVALAMRNLPELVLAFWGAAALGAIVVPLNAWWTGPELRYAVENAGAKVVFADAERVQRLAGSDGGFAATVIVVGTREGAGGPHVGDLVRGDPLEETEIAALAPDDPVMIMFTSGTTGRPKGALITGRNITASIMNMTFMAVRDHVIGHRAMDQQRQPSVVVAGPLFHIGGLGVIVGGAMTGAKSVLMTKWDTEEFLRLAEQENVTGLGGVPAMARQLLEHPAAGRLKSVAGSFALGGASVPPDLPRRAREIFGDSLQLLNGYGLTETTSAVVTNVGAEYAERPDSVGRPNLTADLRVLDPDGKPLPAGEIGELYVVDRLKDVVIRGGENVYCAEVEAVLFEHPAVAEVAIVGLPDQAMGERACAVVVPRPGHEPRLEDLREFAKTRLAAFKHPEALYLIKGVPRTATGKVAKRTLRSVLEDNAGQIQRLP